MWTLFGLVGSPSAAFTLYCLQKRSVDGKKIPLRFIRYFRIYGISYRILSIIFGFMFILILIFITVAFWRHIGIRSLWISSILYVIGRFIGLQVNKCI